MITPETIETYRQQLGKDSTDLERMVAFLRASNGKNGINSIYLAGAEHAKEFEQNQDFDALIGLFVHSNGDVTLSAAANKGVPEYVYYSRILGIDLETVPEAQIDRRIVAQNQQTTATEGMPSIVLGFGKRPGANTAEIMTLTYTGGMSPRNSVGLLKFVIEKAAHNT